MFVNCIECGFETSSKELYWCHIDKCHQQNHSIKRGVDATEEHKRVIPIKCAECEYQSNESKEFRVHCLDVHKNERPFKCLQCDIVFQYKPIVCTHAKRCHDLNMCSFCDGIYQTKKDLDIHLNINHQKKVYLRCPICEFQSEAANNSTNPEEETSNAGDVKSKGQDRIHKCSQCSFTCNLSRGLIIHNKINHTKPKFPCSRCIRHFRSKIALENHIKILHTLEPIKMKKRSHSKKPKKMIKRSHSKKPKKMIKRSHLQKPQIMKSYLKTVDNLSGKGIWKCVRCKFAAHDRESVLKHQSKEHVNKKCFVCGLPFVGESKLLNHMKSHKECTYTFSDKTIRIELLHCYWECVICCEEFVSKSDLIRHCILEHEMGKPAQCNKCNLRTSSMKELKIHVNLVHGNPIHKCPQCIFGASTEIDLARHMSRVHSETKCPQCLLCFDRDDELAVHFYFEHKETFKCDKCNFDTNLQQELMNHKTIKHFLSRYFCCSVCEFSTEVIKELKIHVSFGHKRSEILPQFAKLFNLKCTTCDLIFSRREDLKNHFKKKHPDYPYTMRQNLEEMKLEFVNSEEIPDPVFQVKSEAVEERDFYSMNVCETFLEDHLSLNDSTKGSFQCSNCEEIFSNQANLSLHVKTDHLKYLKCNFCDVIYSKLGALMEHMKSDHPNSDALLEVNNTTGVDGLENRAADLNETRTDSELVDAIKCEVIEEPERIYLDSNVIIKTEEMDIETNPM